MEILNNYTGLLALLALVTIVASTIGLYLRQGNSEAEINRSISGLRSQLESEGEKNSEAFSQQNIQINTLKETQESRIAAVSTDLANSRDELFKKIHDVGTTLGSNTNKRTQQILDSLLENTESVQRAKLELSEELSGYQSKLVDILNSLQTQSEKQSQSLASSVNQLEQLSSERTESLLQALQQQTIQSKDVLETAVAQISGQILEGDNSLSEKLESQQQESKTSATQLRENISALNQTLLSAQDALSGLVESGQKETLVALENSRDGITALEQMVARSQTVLAKALETGLKDSAQTVEKELQSLTEEVSYTGQRLAEHTDASLFQLNQQALQHAVLVAQSVRVDSLEKIVEGDEIKIDTPEAITTLAEAKVTKVTDKSTGTETYFEYKNGQKAAAKSYVDGVLKYQIEFDALGNMRSSAEYDENGQVASRYTYDSAGEVEKFEALS